MGALWGLHGVVVLRARGGRYHFEIRWSPPWTPFGCLFVLLGHGVRVGTGYVVGPVCLGLAVMLVAVYHGAATRAAAELRWSFVKREDPI